MLRAYAPRLRKGLQIRWKQLDLFKQVYVSRRIKGSNSVLITSGIISLGMTFWGLDIVCGVQQDCAFRGITLSQFQINQ